MRGFHRVCRCAWRMGLVWLVALAPAHADEVTDQINTFWELQWHQSGYLSGFNRWPTSDDKRLTYSFNADADSSNRGRVRDALQTVLDQMGWQAQELRDDDPKAQIGFEVRELSKTEAMQFSCWARPHRDGVLLKRVDVLLSSRWAYTCVLHELMHAMGLAGHPSGDTVLSYFKGNGLRLTELDRFMLRAWYSSALQPGMSPLEATRTIGQQWIRQYLPPEKQAAGLATEQKWADAALQELERFAEGSGKAPAILYRSGRVSEAGMRLGRLQVQYLLGWSYLGRGGLPLNPDKAAEFLVLAHESGHSAAAETLVAESLTGALKHRIPTRVCRWATALPAAQRGALAADLDKLQATPPCAPVGPVGGTLAQAGG